MVPAQPHNRFFARIGVGQRDLATNLEALPELVHQAALYAVMVAGEVIRARAWELANVSPGVVGNAVDGTHMRDNINVVPSLNERGAYAKIGIDLSIVPYAHHQEFGSRGKPFLRPAMDENRDLVREIMASAIRSVYETGDFPDVVVFTRFYRGRP